MVDVRKLRNVALAKRATTDGKPLILRELNKLNGWQRKAHVRGEILGFVAGPRSLAMRHSAALY